MATYRGIADRLAAARKLFGDAGKLVEEAEALTGTTASASPRPPGARPRGRPPAAARTTGAANPAPGAKVTLSQLPGIIAQRYPQTGANAEEIVAIMGWKPATPMSNLGRLLKAGSLVKVGDRYMARMPEQAQAAA